MTGVRYRPEGFEGLCEACRHYWPLTFECWAPHSGLARCRACQAEGREVRLPTLKRPMTDAQKLAHRIYNRGWMRRDRAARRRMTQLLEYVA